MTYFLHVPSSGGTTLWAVFNEMFVPGGDRRPVVKRMGRNSMWLNAHPSSFGDLKVYGGHFSIDEARAHADGDQIISMVRDPVDRCISETYRRIRNGNWDETGDEHPALRYAREHGSLISEQLGGSLPDDVVFGVFERYEESLEMFAQLFDWPSVPELPHRNKGENRIEAGADVRAEIASFLTADFAIYNAVVAAF